MLPNTGDPHGILSSIAHSDRTINELAMDEDFSINATPSEVTELTAEEDQRASLQIYLESLPYKCESIEDMQAKLEYIVGNITICAKAQNWLVLSTWDGVLQCWLLMHYPMPKTTRAKLARLYYELCLLPGIEPRVIRSWAEILSRLLSNKPGLKRKLEANELELPWEPLWRALVKEIWPKKRLYEPSRNLVNIYLYIAEQCKRYYPEHEVANMLNTFLPLVTKDSILTLVPVFTSFLPPTNPHLYMPVLFSLWQAFNSSVLDDRLLEFMATLSEEHIAAEHVEGGAEGAAWKDIGIWTDAQWKLLIGKGLSSMNVPIGAAQGASTTSGQADGLADKFSLRIKKTINRMHSLAKLIVYSLSLDGDVREGENLTGYLAGSKALDSLSRLLTSTESFFHPSNSGPWTALLTCFISKLSSEFMQRYKEEEQTSCKTPISRRITPAIRKALVSILRTPALLAIFAKDPLSAGYAQMTLKTLAMLEPGMIMPEILDRAYGGLEAVNETHRTTAVLNMLCGVPLPLVSESVWLGGQRHILPLLELCIPGIDLNDPTKTVCATSFIVSIAQHIMIGDLTRYTSNAVDQDDDESMDLSEYDEDAPRLSRSDERSVVRDSTASFADWITSLIRRVLSLYENLPEEGGKRNTLGGKQEENVLKSIKAMMDIVFLHLSDELFDLVLNMAYDYATTNAKSNAIQPFGQMVSSLARAKPDRTTERFLPYCIRQIEEELKHGASSVRTTSSHATMPSDTTLHWNLAILRGCLGFASNSLVKHKEEVLRLLRLLVESTKSERGYSSTGRLITRVVHAVAEIYPLNSRFVNTNEWESQDFKSDHNLDWGRLYDPEDVAIEWHIPSEIEINFVLQILDDLMKPALDKLDALLDATATWDNVARNDFCRYLNACRAVWNGLPVFLKEEHKDVVSPCIHDSEIPELIPTSLDMEAGFTLTDSSDPRYQRVLAHRIRFGNVLQRAASALRQNVGGEDHIDAVLTVGRAIDVYLLAYALTRSEFDSLQKNYSQAREAHRLWPRQKENSRLVFLKRAQVYHSGRVYMHALYRRRNALDDALLSELVELSLSPYTRIRRHAQAILTHACGYFVRSTRFILPALFTALEKGNDPDRIKGALYVLWNKGTAAYALNDINFQKRYLVSLLECQHEEKPSIQKLVGNLANDCLSHLTEEAVSTDAYAIATPSVENALSGVETEFSSNLINPSLLSSALEKKKVRISERYSLSEQTVSSILEIAKRPTTHWRYVQIGARFLLQLIRRDADPQPELLRFFMEQTTSPQPGTRTVAQKGISRSLLFIKIRTYSSSLEELWRDEWKNPLSVDVPIENKEQFLDLLMGSVDEDNVFFVDKIPTGFLTWASSVKGYRQAGESAYVVWEQSSQPALSAIREVISGDNYFGSLAALWSQETGKAGGSVDLRQDNILFIKSIVKIFEKDDLDQLPSVVGQLITDSDKFKQRAGAEILAGLLRGAKHWSQSSSQQLWSWFGSQVEAILSQIKPETLSFWETLFNFQLRNRDPRRHAELVSWIMSLPLEFEGDSAFAMSKPISLLGLLFENLGMRFTTQNDVYLDLLLRNANTNYAEIRGHICQILFAIVKNEWMPSYPDTETLLSACTSSDDPLHVRDAKYIDRINAILAKMPEWRENRLPPPRVHQSEYDKVGMTMLLWMWVSAHSPQASLLLPYIMPMMPEIFRMSELSDDQDLQLYSSAVLYVISAVAIPIEYVPTILNNFAVAIKSSTSWRIRLHAMPAMVVFFYRNLLSISSDGVSQVMEVLLDCLGDENVEVREMASKMLSGVVRCSQRERIVPLKKRFVALAQKHTLPARRDPSYSEALRSLHSAILGLCALIESLPYSVESWMPPLTEVLAAHATDPPPISTTIRKCASEFKKTHQDTWHKDQHMFDEDQLQSLSTMLVLNAMRQTHEVKEDVYVAIDVSDFSHVCMDWGEDGPEVSDRKKSLCRLK